MIERGRAVLFRDQMANLQVLRAGVDCGDWTDWPGEQQRTFTRPPVDTQPVEVREQGRLPRVEWL